MKWLESCGLGLALCAGLGGVTAAQAGITLIGIARDDDFEIFTRPDRVVEGVAMHV